MQPSRSSAAPAVAPVSTVSTALVDALCRLGVTHAFGVMGGAIAPFFHAVAHGPLTTLHLRHEAGAAFAAVEASLATRRPVLVFTTAGPGLTNALTGMLAARWDGAHVIFVSASTAAAHRGRVATQETTAATLGGPGLFLTGGGLHYATTIEHPAQLAPVLGQLASGLTRPGGFVAHLSLPIDIQNTPCPGTTHLDDRRALVPTCAPGVFAEHAALFVARPPVIWLGFGARHAAAPIRALVERTGARVICTPRGKGVVSEDHPRFIGVTGLGGHTRLDDVLAADRPTHTLVLGTRMGESLEGAHAAGAPLDDVARGEARVAVRIRRPPVHHALLVLARPAERRLVGDQRRPERLAGVVEALLDEGPHRRVVKPVERANPRVHLAATHARRGRATRSSGRPRSSMKRHSGLSLLARLHGPQLGTRLSGWPVPPRERGITWSKVRSSGEPQYWQEKPSRRNRLKRVNAGYCDGFTYWRSAMTLGIGIVFVGE